MPVSPDTRHQSEGQDDLIVVIQDDSQELPTNLRQRRTIRQEMDAASNSDIAEDRDDHKFEIQLPPGTKPHLSIPKSWSGTRDPNAPLAGVADVAKSRKSMQTEDMTEAPPQPRGRKRKALTEEERHRSNLMRRLGACDSCRKRKLAVSQLRSFTLHPKG